jgi:hypothetical protein
LQKTGKKKIFFNLHGGGSTFLYLGSSQIINDPPKKNIKKTTQKNPLNAISDAQF